MIGLTAQVLALLYFTAVSAQSYTAVSADTTTGPVVNLGYVSYAGYTNATAGINYFRGIPYAQSPTGQLRWQKPQPIEASNNFTGQVINATQIAPGCYQSTPEALIAPSVCLTCNNHWSHLNVPGSSPSARDRGLLDTRCSCSD